MLQINYLAESHLIEIKIDAISPAWLEIVRICRENTDEVKEISPVSLELPWWAFLSCGNGLRIIAKKHNINVQIDNMVQQLLISAKEKRSTYNKAEQSTLLSANEIEKKLIAVGFLRSLTAQQIRNVARLVSLPAAATFSVPGAGKTTEALAYFFLKKNEATKLLVVAPKNAFAAWESELLDCKPDAPNITRLGGGARNIAQLLSSNPKIMLVTYQQLPNVLSIVANFLSLGESFVFLDESHRIKRGNDGVIGKSVLQISHIPSAKLIMSGTPLPNAPSDLIPQFNFLYPEVRVDEETVIEYIKPLYVRTTKRELGLPEPKYKLVPIEMSLAQRRLYNLLRSETARQVEQLRAEDRIKLRTLGKSVLRMLQLTSNPSLLAKTDFRYNELLRDVLMEGDSRKVQYVCSRARQLANHGKKVVIWSSFVDNVELISLRLKDIGADYIHGGVDAGGEDESDTREAKLREFHNNPNAKVLVANPAAAGEGISLHKVCHHAIYLDRNYNAAHFLQSVDRIHRLGLPPETETIVEIVICPDSVDQSVQRRLETKINHMMQVLEDPGLRIQPEYADEEFLGDDFNLEDIADFLEHLKGY